MAQNQPVFSWSSILLGACLVGTLICDAPAQGTGGSSANHPGVAGSATATYPGAPFRNTVGQPPTFQNSVGQTTHFGNTANRSAAAPSNPGNLNSGGPLCRLCGAGAKSRHRSERFADRHHRLRTGLARAADQFGEQVSASAAPSQEADRRQVLAQKLRFTWIESTNPERLDRLPQGNHRAFRVEPIRAFQGARIGPASTSGVDSRAQVL